MKRDESIIAAINELWTPVYPFMAEYLLGLCGPTPHALLELGPFSGGIALSLLRSEPGCSATVLDESGEVLDWTMERARQDGNSARLLTRQTALPPIPEADTSFDVVAIRGAFFFLTASLLREVWRVLKPGGLAWVGGGYGPSTPRSVIEPIADESRSLNERLGKKWLAPEEARRMCGEAGLGDSARISTRGGLWIEVRR